MIWQHFKAIAWLRWRLSANQWKRGGTLNAVLGLILLVMFLSVSAFSFFIALLVGILTFPHITPDQLMLMWDAILLAFLFMWIMGLVTELQRSEALSVENLLHLPVSLTGTFLLNYLSSWLSLSLILFLPTSTGLCLALAIIKGPEMLILFPLLISFVVMITAITHQFRRWLQVLMLNKRRRRAIVACVTAAFILLAQVPNLVNIAVQRSRGSSGPSEYQLAVEQLRHDMQQGKIDLSEYQQRVEELKNEEADKKVGEKTRIYRRVVSAAALVNLVLPIGWLPYGAQAAASGGLLPGVLGTLGATLIGGLCLWRSYRTSVRFYTGGFRAGGGKRTQQAQSTASADNFLERKIAWLPEQVTAIMLGGMRSLLRAPEGKMLLLAPIILLGFFAMMIFWGRDRQVSELARPFLGIGVISMTMLSFVQVLCNAFGFDRAGFRSVLSPCRRHYILLGKNLAIAPLAIGVSCIGLVCVQLFMALPLTQFLATLVQLAAAYVLMCLVGNVVSAIAPSAIAGGTLKPAKAKVATIIIHIVAALFSFLVLLPACIVLGIEALVRESGWLPDVPIYLCASLIELGVAVWIYHRLLPLQGRFLQNREQAILEAVTAKAE